MKKIIIKSSVLILVVCSVLYAQKQFKINRNVFLANVEALASSESGGSYCYGYGSVDCGGYKVDRIVTGCCY